MKRKKVAFIVSAGHSGSSLLSVIMGSHPRCFSAGEFGNLPNRYRKGLFLDCVNQDSVFWEENFGLEGIRQLAVGLGDTRATALIPLKLEKKLREFLGNDYIFNPYTLMFSKLDKDVILDATKYDPFVSKKLKAREFRERQLDGYLIYLVRDGRAVLNSRLRKFKSTDVAEFSKDWVEKTKRRQNFFHSFREDRKIKVVYEELASNPQKTIQTLCQLLELDFREDMLAFWKHEHHDISGNDGTYSLIRRYQGKEILDRVREIHGEHYSKIEPSIQLDLRWKTELPKESLEVFSSIAGDVNSPYAWDN